MRNDFKLQPRLRVHNLQLAILQTLSALSVGLLVITLVSPSHYRSLRLGIMAVLQTSDNWAVIELPSDRPPVQKLGD